MSNTKATLVKRQLDEWALTQAHMRKVVDTETSLLSWNPFQQPGETKTLKPLRPISTAKVSILTPQDRKAALTREHEEEEGGAGNLTVKSEPKLKRSVTTSSRGFNWSKNAS